MAVPIDTFMEDNVLPNYESECMVLSLVLIGTSVFWVVVFPYVVGRLLFEPKETSKEKQSTDVTGDHKKKEDTTAEKPSTKQRRGKNSKKSVKDAPTTTANNSAVAPPPEPAIPLPVVAVAAFGLMVSLFYQVMTLSPYNTFVARGVFQVPMLTAEECEALVNISMRAAKQNELAALNVQELSKESGEPVNKTTESLLWDPPGWQKLRHGNYPTTDLNVITDPFSKQDLDWLQEKLDARLAPTLARIYGLPESAIRANDMFVVRYDSDYRAHLSNHTDDSDISFNILLTDDFEGGGTRFWNRHTQQSFAHVHPNRVGHMLTHTALLNHEGMPTTKGTRIIFVGFLGVDRIDPFSNVDNPTPKLNTWASWLSLPWVSTKFKEAYSSMVHRRQNGEVKYGNNKYIEALFLDMANVLQIVGDYFAEHHVKNLVSNENAEKYLQNLDEAYRERQQQETDKEIQANHKATWFAGQQIDLDIDGTVTAEWHTRKNSKNRFMEL